jgi:WS/DGAT/MGAT family acyltransferase
MAERPMRFERRMTDGEALMWTVEKDPALRASFLNITILDRAPDFDRLRTRMERAVQLIPRLRQHVVSPPARVAPPQWVDDPDFDIGYHLRRIAVPAPGDDRALLDMAAKLYEDAFDRARPLWLFHVVEGLSGGRAAFLAKMHHTITDGVGGLRLSMQFLDLARDAPDPEPVAIERGDDGEDADGDTTESDEDGLLGAAIHAAGNRVRRNLGIARRTVGEVAGNVTHPSRMPALASDSVELARSLLRQLAVVEPARSPLWTGRRSLRRHFEAVSLDLDGLKATAKALGGTVNDAYVTGIAGAAGAYHRAHGVEVDDLRMSMPVNLRDDRSAGGNAFSPARVLVPAGTEDPIERFAEVHARLTTTKTERALGLTDSLAGMLNGLPTAVVVRLARQQVETVDFATSNLRGANFDLYMGGAHVLANHPMGPTAGTAFNATVLGYKDSLDLGLNIDTAAINDPGLLRSCFEEAFAELVKIGRS